VTKQKDVAGDVELGPQAHRVFRIEPGVPELRSAPPHIEFVRPVGVSEVST